MRDTAITISTKLGIPQKYLHNMSQCYTEESQPMTIVQQSMHKHVYMELRNNKKL